MTIKFAKCGLDLISMSKFTSYWSEWPRLIRRTLYIIKKFCSWPCVPVWPPCRQQDKRADDHTLQLLRTNPGQATAANVEPQLRLLSLSHAMMRVDNNTCVNETQLLALLKTVIDAGDQGVFMSENVTNSRWVNEWDLTRSVYFIFTTLTTIGLSPHPPACLTRTHHNRKQFMLYRMHEMRRLLWPMFPKCVVTDTVCLLVCLTVSLFVSLSATRLRVRSTIMTERIQVHVWGRHSGPNKHCARWGPDPPKDSMWPSPNYNGYGTNCCVIQQTEKQICCSC